LSTTTNTNPEISDATIRIIDSALTHFQENADENNAEAEIRKIIEFISNVIDHPEDGADLYFEYVLPDPVQGRRIIERLGVDATFGQLADAIANGTISRHTLSSPL
jgi:hypothetical protein